jgi:hypothetical protein
MIVMTRSRFNDPIEPMDLANTALRIIARPHGNAEARWQE